LAGRVVMALVFVTLAYGLAGCVFSGPTETPSPELWVLPRLGAFALAALVAAVIQGARPGGTFLLAGAFLAILLAWLLVPSTPSAFGERAGTLGAGHVSSASGLELCRLQSVMLSAVFLGTWFARSLEMPGHLLAVVLCAAAGDAWYGVMHVVDSVSVTHPLRLVQFPWPPATGTIVSAPAFADVLFLSLYLETARRLGFSVWTVFAGAAGGYILASLLSLATWQVTLSLPLMGLGVLMGAWPAFRCSAREVLKAFALALVLFSVLLGLTILRAHLHPAPPPRPDRLHSRDLAGSTGTSISGCIDTVAAKGSAFFL
jgi:hypothetical protein